MSVKQNFPPSWHRCSLAISSGWGPPTSVTELFSWMLSSRTLLLCPSLPFSPPSALPLRLFLPSSLALACNRCAFICAAYVSILYKPHIWGQEREGTRNTKIASHRCRTGEVLTGVDLLLTPPTTTPPAPATSLSFTKSQPHQLPRLLRPFYIPTPLEPTPSSSFTG